MPGTLLTTIPGEDGWFSVPDLKDTFFTILVENESQWLTPIFPTTWEAEIERFADSDQPKQVIEIPISISQA
jgi:hypothetical protein